jgi:hypothetical protein
MIFNSTIAVARPLEDCPKDVWALASTCKSLYTIYKSKEQAIFRSMIHHLINGSRGTKQSTDMTIRMLSLRTLYPRPVDPEEIFDLLSKPIDVMTTVHPSQFGSIFDRVRWGTSLHAPSDEQMASWYRRRLAFTTKYGLPPPKNWPVYHPFDVLELVRRKVGSGVLKHRAIAKRATQLLWLYWQHANEPKTEAEMIAYGKSDWIPCCLLHLECPRNMAVPAAPCPELVTHRGDTSRWEVQGLMLVKPEENTPWRN